MTGLITILSFISFFGLIAWAEIYFRKLNKEQILDGLKTTGLMLLLIIAVWIFFGAMIGNIALLFIVWITLSFALSLSRFFRKKKVAAKRQDRTEAD